MKDEDQARADSAQAAGENAQDVESQTEHITDGSDSDGEISKEEQAFLDSIKDPSDFMNVADQVGPNTPKEAKEAQEDDEAEDDSEESDDDQEESENEDAEEEEETEDESEEEESEEEDDDSEETEESEEEDEEEAEEEETPKDKTPSRYRLRSDNPVEQRAFELKKRNADMSLEECLNRAKQELGQNEQSTDKDKGDDKGQEQSGPQTVAEVDTEVEKLETQYEKAFSEDLDFTKASEIQKQINKLNRLRGDLSAQEVVGSLHQQREFDRVSAQSKERAVELYPFTTDPKSPEVARINEIFETFKETNDDRLSDPNLPLLLAQMVAKERGIAPKGTKFASTKKPKSTDGKPPKKKGTVQPARGNARTTPKSNSGQLDDSIDKISSVHEYERLLGQA